MKDRQIQRKAEGAHIPVISPLLHVATMPVLVLLRRDFGYVFLRPKSIFLSLCWAMGLFAVYSYFRPEKWNQNPELWWFLIASGGLYIFHLSASIAAQFSKAPHDQFGGYSWLSALVPDRSNVSLWVEPVIVLVASAVLRLKFGENSLSSLLTLLALLLFSKEAINQWAKLRKIKHQIDATEDAEETMEIVADERDLKPVKKKAVKTSRKSRVARKRATVENTKDIEHYATILRMFPPYSLEQAEENFQKLVKQFHPDSSGSAASENGDAITKLTEARQFFRKIG